MRRQLPLTLPEFVSSAATQGIALQEKTFAHVTDPNSKKSKTKQTAGGQIRKSYPEAEKREGVDGGLNRSNTCKRRSVKTLLVNGRRDLSIITHDSPTSGWRGHSKNPRYPNPQVGQYFVYVATTLCHIVSAVYRCPAGGLNDVIENNHLGVLATAPWNARWH